MIQVHFIVASFQLEIDIGEAIISLKFVQLLFLQRVAITLCLLPHFIFDNINHIGII